MRKREKGTTFPMSDNLFTSLNTPASATIAIAANVWPVATGAGLGQFVATSAEWSKPWLVAVLTGACVQLLIALLRSLFTERRDVMTAMRDMLKERDIQERAREEAERVTRADEQRMRHELANMANSAQLRAMLMEHGIVSTENPPPLYDIEAEKTAEEKRRAIARKALPKTDNGG